LTVPTTPQVAVLSIVLFIALLIAANALFSMAEMALVSSRKARLQQMADEGRRGAAVALVLAQNPQPLLTVVQVVLNVSAILSGALAEGHFTENLADSLSGLPLVGAYAHQTATAIVVAVLTLATVLFGELVPKRVALHNPEGVARAVAGPMTAISRLLRPLVAALSHLTDFFLRMLGAGTNKQLPVTWEEIQVLMEQGKEAGVFVQTEHDIITSLYRMGEQRVLAIMTPRVDIEIVDLERPVEDNLKRIRESTHDCFPVCRGGIDNVLGMLEARALLSSHLAGKPLDLAASLAKPLYVPDTLTAIQVLETFKRSRQSVALVIDEFGVVQGLVNMHDVMAALVGDVPVAGAVANPLAVQRPDGSWLLDGMLDIDAMRDILGLDDKLPGQDSGNFVTVAGFVMATLGRVPEVADRFELGGFRYEVVDMERNRVDQVLATRLPEPSTAGARLDE
jgi:putative hemolysin